MRWWRFSASVRRRLRHPLGVGASTGDRDDPLAVIRLDSASTPATIVRAQRVEPPLVNSRITLRTWLSSVSHLAGIDGADTRALEPNTIDARPRVDACFARFASRLSRNASSCASGLTTAPRDASPPPRSRCNQIRHQQRVSGQTSEKGH